MQGIPAGFSEVFTGLAQMVPPQAFERLLKLALKRSTGFISEGETIKTLTKACSAEDTLNLSRDDVKKLASAIRFIALDTIALATTQTLTPESFVKKFNKRVSCSAEVVASMAKAVGDALVHSDCGLPWSGATWCFVEDEEQVYRCASTSTPTYFASRCRVVSLDAKRANEPQQVEGILTDLSRR